MTRKFGEIVSDPPRTSTKAYDAGSTGSFCHCHKPDPFSVVLKYDVNTMMAPAVLTKAADHMAFRIREIAEEHGIPIMEKPPLALALHATLGVADEIPTEH